jgi:hypothetical protein
MSPILDAASRGTHPQPLAMRVGCGRNALDDRIRLSDGRIADDCPGDIADVAHTSQISMISSARDAVRSSRPRSGSPPRRLSAQPNAAAQLAARAVAELNVDERAALNRALTKLVLAFGGHANQPSGTAL